VCFVGGVGGSESRGERTGEDVKTIYVLYFVFFVVIGVAHVLCVFQFHCCSHLVFVS
jgi:hypothetical protein